MEMKNSENWPLIRGSFSYGQQYTKGQEATNKGLFESRDLILEFGWREPFLVLTRSNFSSPATLYPSLFEYEEIQ
ncbi:hypothetical protein Ahy_B03g063101 isoform B [Arachis hypogaea]|uniref:Uncharacterized protein n=1 Tax=Arachis hypogaea TaxID=3818 RepID=A0A444ZWD4_ARAHY|nr:hypothetical protein Ahy_B03g063101 isoform B [Arachis hypogaea]